MQDIIKDILINAGIEPTPSIMRMLRTTKSAIVVPNKVVAKLNRLPKKAFKTIHPDVDVAKELVLLIVSNLSNTFMIAQHTDDKRKKDGFKRLYSKILASQVKYDRDTTSPYKKCLDLLIDNGIIERGKLGSTESRTSTEYRLTSNYYGKGCENYNLSSNTVQRMKNKEFNTNFEKVISTNIGKNHLKMRAKVQFPSDDEVKKVLDFAVKTKYHNKAGKRLVWLGKHSKDVYPETRFVYAETYLKSYIHLRDHMTVPIVKDEYLVDGKLVFRIATCFNLMPSLIRSHIKVEGKRLYECDFSAMHPNIIQKIYGGENKEAVSHDKVALELFGIPKDDAERKKRRKEVKLEHLSFFNKRVEDMKRSPLYEYYEEKQPLMLSRIEEDKNNYGHEYTCREVFKVETQIMDLAIKRLNEMGVDVMYVYDALYSIKSEQPTVKRVMNEVAELFGVQTRVGV
jgi:hypothetical protein